MIYLQENYLIDKASNTGKGGNTIISLLHHFLATHSLGETSVHFHADNCCGQNKNYFLMSYFMQRVLVGLHKEIKVSFLPVGHTKFSPDWCFGHLMLVRWSHQFETPPTVPHSELLRYSQLEQCHQGNQCSQIVLSHLGYLWSINGTSLKRSASTALTTARIQYSLDQQRHYHNKAYCIYTHELCIFTSLYPYSIHNHKQIRILILTKIPQGEH